MNRVFLVVIDVPEESPALRDYLKSLDAFEIAAQTYLVCGEFHPMNLKMQIEQRSNPMRDGIFVVPLAVPRVTLNFDRLTAWLEEQTL